LDDDLALDQQIGPKLLIELEILVLDRNGNLPVNPQTLSWKIMCKHPLIHQLQQTRTDFLMNEYAPQYQPLLFRSRLPSLSFHSLGVLARA